MWNTDRQGARPDNQLNAGNCGYCSGIEYCIAMVIVDMNLQQAALHQHLV
jgi:hypothetical protein